MRPLALFAVMVLGLFGITSVADAAGRRTTVRTHWGGSYYGPPYGGDYRQLPIIHHTGSIHAGPPFGGYYRTVALFGRGSRAWIDEGPPFGGYYRTVALFGRGSLR
jgi:hypothetical protein